jgi:3-polyprenyl-4-hydroxybenzoate decarboxylase
LNNKRRLIIGISGATGAIYGVRMLQILSKIEDVETHLVLSKAGKMTIQVETPYSVKDVEAMADAIEDILGRLDVFSHHAAEYARRHLRVDDMLQGLVDAIRYAKTRSMHER